MTTTIDIGRARLTTSTGDVTMAVSQESRQLFRERRASYVVNEIVFRRNVRFILSCANIDDPDAFLKFIETALDCLAGRTPLECLKHSFDLLQKEWHPEMPEDERLGLWEKALDPKYPATMFKGITWEILTEQELAATREYESALAASLVAVTPGKKSKAHNTKKTKALA